MFPLSLYFSDQPVRWTEKQLWTNICAYYSADEEDTRQQLLELLSQLQIDSKSLSGPAKNTIQQQESSLRISLESAITQKQAKQSFSRYLETIEAIAKDRLPDQTFASVSIKISSLHPQFSPLKGEQMIKDVTERVMHLLVIARSLDVQIILEAEQPSFMEVTLKVFARLLESEACRDWSGLGISLLSESKQALPALSWLSFLAKKLDATIPVSLVEKATYEPAIRGSFLTAGSDSPTFCQTDTHDLSYRVTSHYLMSHHCPKLSPIFETSNPDTQSETQPPVTGQQSPLIGIESEAQLQRLLLRMAEFNQHQWSGAPLINGEIHTDSDPVSRFSPSDLNQQIGSTSMASIEDVLEAYAVAKAAFTHWYQTTLETRIKIVQRFIQALEQHSPELITLCIRETGIPLPSAIIEVQTAIATCQAYCDQVNNLQSSCAITSLTDANYQLQYVGLGVIVCISSSAPPLSSYAGQVVAALLAGNTVVAKPSSRTPLTAFRLTELLLDSGLPVDVISFIPGSSQDLGVNLLSDYRLSGIALTGSARTAGEINLQLAQRHSLPITPLIAQDSSRAVMIADETVSIESTVKEIIQSTFDHRINSSSALQVVYLQEELIEQAESMLIDAISLLKVGKPEMPETDIGPAIDIHALQTLHGHIEQCREEGQILYEYELRDHHDQGYYVPPTLIRLHSLNELSHEYSGPALHLISFAADNLPRVIDEINRSTYAVTLQVHSQNSEAIQQIQSQVLVRNLYINRSGTTDYSISYSPDYLKKFVREKKLFQQ